jgi:haloacetate dehalogenase
VPIVTKLGVLFPGFAARMIETSGAVIHTLRGGTGPPLLLLHGHPQTMACWHKIAGELARDFTIILADLRGYGDSSKPVGGDEHVNYSKRAMALDLIETMETLGYRTFMAAGHDRGGRVLHRMLRDHPDHVMRAALLDIAPTAAMYAATDMAFATRYIWWFFLIQPAPVPETLIGGQLDYYLTHHVEAQNKTPGAIDPRAMAEYRRCYTRETLHAVCEDYRASAGIDLAHDSEDARDKIKVPLLALWGAKGVVGTQFDVLALWREQADDVCGFALSCGHYLPEEAPGATQTALLDFFRG